MQPHAQRSEGSLPGEYRDSRKLSSAAAPAAANSRSFDCVNHLLANDSTPLGMTGWREHFFSAGGRGGAGGNEARPKHARDDERVSDSC